MYLGTCLPACLGYQMGSGSCEYSGSPPCFLIRVEPPPPAQYTCDLAKYIPTYFLCSAAITGGHPIMKRRYIPVGVWFVRLVVYGVIWLKSCIEPVQTRVLLQSAHSYRRSQFRHRTHKRPFPLSRSLKVPADRDPFRPRGLTVARPLCAHALCLICLGGRCPCPLHLCSKPRQQWRISGEQASIWAKHRG